MKKNLIKLTSFTLAAALLAGCQSQSNNKPAATSSTDAANVVATIGDKAITEEAFYQELKQAAGDVTLRSMILKEVLESKVSNPEEFYKDAEETVAKQATDSGGDEVFQQLLAYQGLGTVDQYVDQVYTQKLLQEAITQELDLSDDQLKAFYDKDYEPYMEAQHILVDEEETAQEVINRLEEGEEFDALAQQYSKDTSAENGGLLSPFKSGQMVKEFEEAVKGLKNGEFTKKPVKSQFGYHVIKTIKNGEKPNFDEEKEAIREAYIDYNLNNTRFSLGIISQLLKDANIEVKDDEFKDVVTDLINAGADLKVDTELDTESNKEEEKEDTDAAEEEKEDADAEEAEAEDSAE